MARVRVLGQAINRATADDKMVVVPSAVVKAFVAGTSDEIDLYATEGAGSPSSITTDSDGVFNFWINITDANKRIKIVVTKSEYGTLAVDNYQVIYDLEILQENASPHNDDILLMEDASDSYNPKKVKKSKIAPTKESFIIPLFDNNYGDYASNRMIASEAQRITFRVPEVAGTIAGIYVVFISETTFSDQDIDLHSNYGASGETYNNHSESDTTSVYSATADKNAEIDASGVFSSVSPGDYCGLRVTTNLAGGNFINLLGVRIEYSL